MSEVRAPVRQTNTTTKDDPILPGPPIEIHVWPDFALEVLAIDPRGLLSVPEVQALSAMLRQKGVGVADRVLHASDILSRFGWRVVSEWVEPRYGAPGVHDLHVKMQRPARTQ